MALVLFLKETLCTGLADARVLHTALITSLHTLNTFPTVCGRVLEGTFSTKTVGITFNAVFWALGTTFTAGIVSFHALGNSR